MIVKTTKNNKRPTEHYREEKLGLIDHLSIVLLRKQNTLVKDTEHSPVSSIRKFFEYLIGFILANIFCVIPLITIQTSLADSTNTTQILADIPLRWTYIIIFFIFLFYAFYYVYIPLKIWPGQTLVKYLLGYKIVMMNSSKITARALFMRNVIGMTFLKLAAFTTTYVVQLIVLTAKIDYLASFGYITYFTTLLSFVITLTNYDRRMLHDCLGKAEVYILRKERVSDYHALQPQQHCRQG